VTTPTDAQILITREWRYAARALSNGYLLEDVARDLA